MQEILGDAETMKTCEPPYDLAKTEGFMRSFCMERRGAVAAVHKASERSACYVPEENIKSGNCILPHGVMY